MSIWHRGARGLKAMGWKQTAIAELFGVTDSAVSFALTRAPKPRDREVSIAHLRKAWDVIKAKAYARRVAALQMKLAGKTNKAIARDLGVSAEHVGVMLKAARSKPEGAYDQRI